MVAFGQGTCKPRHPHCDRCVLNDRCPKIGVLPRRIPGREAGGASHRQTVSRKITG
ncbi:MAG: hypothetical protein RQ753_06735 [Desulfurivibrionaceae bacterium]|nr:hypothetical protein [Desulfurivibrionaceae bacterium]